MVCVVFTGITVLNSGMMLAAWDEPKTGSFAYVHLLSRLVIIAAVVALFYVDDLRAWIRDHRRVERPVLRTRVVERLRASLAAPLMGLAYAFTLVTVAGSLAVIAWSFVTVVAGGAGLYRNLLLLALVLAVSLTFTAALLHRRSPDS